MANTSACMAEYDAWEHLCSDAFDHPKKGIVALLTVYFDASENKPSKTRPNPPLLHTVGCYLADREDWGKFRREWRLELEKGGLDHFHMKDFEYAQAMIKRGEREQLSSKSPYKDWSTEDFTPFLKRLHRVINRKRKDGSYRMAAFISSVVKSDFDKTLPVELKDDPECQSYYIFNVANLMKTVAWWCNRNFQRYHYDPIHYIFAHGDGEGNNLEKWFGHCWRDEGATFYYHLSKSYSRLGYDLALMRAEPAIQAADIAAFEYNKVAVEIVERGHANIPADELRKSLPSLSKAGHLGLAQREEELIGSFAQIIDQRKSIGLM